MQICHFMALLPVFKFEISKVHLASVGLQVGYVSDLVGNPEAKSSCGEAHNI